MNPEQVGLDRQEWEHLKGVLGREPNELELRMVGVMWSEHCSYKSTRKLLAKLPKEGRHVVRGEGENAGIVRLSDRLGLAFKVESHNHPSAVSPYEGAATGVGGIIRDILAMGARPIMSMDGLFFGDSDSPKAKHIREKVVEGIGGYGNAVGVPTVGGLTIYDPCYEDNPLVNAFCAGVVELDRLCSSKTARPGMRVVVLGARTGRDGIAGASFASTELKDHGASNKPQIQIGDPFYEKLLIEACLELLNQGVIQAMQDMGAAGLLSSSSEVAHKSGNGIDIHCDRIPLREEMEPWEIFLSESQERMLIICLPEDLPRLSATAEKWGLEWADVGEITDTGVYRVFRDQRLIAQLPVSILGGDSPAKDWPSAPPTRPRPRRDEELLSSQDAADRLRSLLSQRSLMDHSWIYEQYDSMVQLRTVLGPGNPVSALWMRDVGTLVCSMEANPWMCQEDPFNGTALVAASTLRALAVAGAEAMGMTNCLNFPSPEVPHQYWELQRSVEGLAWAARELDCPVVSGNVSLYNESPSSRIMPSPLIVSVGLVPQGEGWLKPNEIPEGAAICLVGSSSGTVGSLYGSLFGPGGSEIAFAPDLERRFIGNAMRTARSGLCLAGRPVTRGGWLSSLVKSLAPLSLGARLDIDWPSPEGYLFGEGWPMAIYFVEPQRVRELAGIWSGFEFRPVGVVTGRATLDLGGCQLNLSDLGSLGGVRG